ncbi:glycosyltransferase family 2 protein [Candidatus Roizmanbacteria bacterium]|nr:glycosyltransferase family 2 protein [Candidatus Roizmanbacteria bacterium]
MTDLSIIIPSFNTKQMTVDCISQLLSVVAVQELNTEIIVVDNGSEDGSPAAILELFKQSKHEKVEKELIALDKNYGFGTANNKAFAQATGTYVLCLNSDVIVKDVDFIDLCTYLHDHPQVGALTVRVNLQDGSIDPASHRGFPTPWRSFTYFTKLEKTFGKLPFFCQLFGGYHLTGADLTSIHQIDSPTGAFFLTRLDLIRELHGFDENFFMYGEDLDFAYRIKELGYQILYYPKYEVTHLKYKSGLQTKSSITRNQIRWHFYNAMRIFYDKHYAKQYPKVVNALIHDVIYRKMKRYENYRD